MTRKSRYDLDYDDIPDPPPRRASHRCVCGTDLPGTCPGPLSCPYSGFDDDVSNFEKVVEQHGTA